MVKPGGNLGFSFFRNDKRAPKRPLVFQLCESGAATEPGDHFRESVSLGSTQEGETLGEGKPENETWTTEKIASRRGTAQDGHNRIGVSDTFQGKIEGETFFF